MIENPEGSEHKIPAQSRVVWIKCDICGLPNPQHTMKQYQKFEHLCGICFKKESALATPTPPTKPVEPPFSSIKNNPYEAALKADIQAFDADVISQLTDQFVIGKNGIATREQYFNAEKTEIAEIEKVLKEHGVPDKELHYMLAKIVRARIDAWSQIFFEPMARKDACQVALNELASKLRAEEREKLKIKDANYRPVAPVLSKSKVTGTGESKTKQPRMSADDKAVASMARSLFGKQIKSNQMTLEQAIERVKQSIRGARAQVFEQIASGERKLSDLPGSEKNSDKKE